MKLHHVAYVTSDLEKSAALWSELFDYCLSGPVVVDAYQGVRIQFMEGVDGALLELLEPFGDQSPVRGHLKKGGGIYHICFEVDQLEKKLDELKASGNAVVVREPARAPAIEGRRVAFIVTARGELVELLEAVK